MSGRRRGKRQGWEREKQGWEKEKKKRERERQGWERKIERVREREIGREMGVGERDIGERERDREIQGEREEETGEKERDR